MNRNQFILVLVALAVLGGAGLVLVHHNQQSWNVRDAKMGDKVLPNFKLKEVAAIHIKGRSDLNIIHENGFWRVRERGDYPASFNQIGALLTKIRDLKVVQSETIGPSQRASLDLDPPERSVLTIDTMNQPQRTSDVSIVRTDPSHS